MQILIFIICGAGLIGLATSIRAAFTAPEAIEDDGGFHVLGTTDCERYAYSHPVTLTEGDVIFFK
jgi:hypothetical protein